MTLKKFYSIILGVVAASLFSCSSDLNNEDNTPVNPNQTAKRLLGISLGDAETRSQVSIQDQNKWIDGDIFLAYNITEPHGVEELRAHGGGESTELKGEVECKDEDEIGVFYPYKLSYGQLQSSVHVSMQKGVASEKGTVVEKEQDGTLATLRFFDYTYGKGKVKASEDGKTATGTVQMKKQYAILNLKFKEGANAITNIKKLVISNIIEEAKFDVLTGELKDKTKGSITIVPAASRDEFDVAVFPDANFSPKFTVVTDHNKVYSYAVTGSKKIESQKYYPITILVAEEKPYIEIGDVKWGKYNLQYTPGLTTDGWEEGYHLAKNPWDYFYTEGDLPKVTSEQGADNQMFDHFRWGDISKAHNYADVNKNHYYTGGNSLTDVITKDAQGNVEFGDIASYASKKKWRIPTPDEFESLMNNSTEYLGYYNYTYKDKDGVNQTIPIYGALFIPDGIAHGYIVPKGVEVTKNAQGKFVDKRGRIVNLQKSNQTGAIPGTQLEEFTAEKINKGIFFPAAGSYNIYNDGAPRMETVSTQGIYWTANAQNATQAYSFTFYYGVNLMHLPTVGNRNAGNRPAKQDMYSIRPVYIGQ